MTFKTIASVGLALIVIALAGTAADARVRHVEQAPSYDRHSTNGWATTASFYKEQRPRTTKVHEHRPYYKKQPNNYPERRIARAERQEAQLLPHPTDCPRVAFCACGASVELFGRSIRELWKVTAWYKFPSAAPGPNMVAIFHAHHLAVIKEVYGDGTALVYDANSGRRQTRLHVRDISRARIVNPHGGSRYAAIR